MATERGTHLGKAFCSAHFRDVPVLIRDVAPGRSTGKTPYPDAGTAVTCLDYGVRCTGWLCPLFSVPAVPAEQLLAEAMEAERLRAGGPGPAAPAPPPGT